MYTAKNGVQSGAATLTGKTAELVDLLLFPCLMDP